MAPPKLSLKRDWKKWDRSQGTGDLEEMYDAALLYADGAPQIPRDPATARKLLEELSGRTWPGKGRALYRLGKLMLDPAAGPVNSERAASLFASAASMLHMDAAVQLARLHEQGRIAGADIKEAERLLRTASAAGNVDGVIGLARLQRSGRVGLVQQAATDDLVKLGLLILYGDLGRGKCSSLYEIGTILADETLVPGGLPEAMKWFEAAARQGDYRGDLALAEIYIQGRAKATPNVVARHLTRAADAGYAQAMTSLGEHLLRGDAVPKDLPKAVAWLEKAGTYSDVDAYKILARHYRGEFGSPPDLPKAAEALSRAAALPGHSASVLVSLARLHVAGIQGKPDIKTALSLYRKAADRGEPSGLTELAKLLLARPQDANGADVLGLLREAADRGSPEAMGVLSDLYECSAIVAPDADQARAWLTRAAAAGHARSIAALGTQANADPAVSRQNMEALIRSAEKGDRESMVLLSFAYRTGQGIDENEQQAIKWLSAALAPGEERVRAQLLLARKLLDGKNTHRDEAGARALLEEVARGGDASATFELGRLLLSPSHTDKAERARGLMLLQKAASSGNAAAMFVLAEQTDDELRSTGKTALDWKRAAAEAGSSRAAIALAALARDSSEASVWIARAESLPVCSARDMVELAQVQSRVNGVQGTERARMWLQRAINDIQLNEPDAATLFLIGRVMLDGTGGQTDKQAALQYLKRSAEAGKVEAMRFLGRNYASGAFGDGNIGPAIEWLAKALRGGDEGAATDLARLAGSSETNAAPAIAALKELAEAGSVPAMREFGRSLQFGFGVEADPEQGANWLRKAAEAGDIIAMKELSRAYASGYGVELSASASTDWLLRAANAGDAEAMYGVSLAMTLGFGTEVNAEAAQKWLTTAETAARK
ncbi:tetratricopeptide repeat protein [Microvirga sp. KLBC 81]|uniref:tetratricopeptide repeat protein n=1 Tax=Microvirga sp. KLBC 81 TaxID=1862707 RepID=UPI001402FC88|nr:SEL1-like repeat protein [Microvirga sp. KLBC 81]